MTQSDTTCGGLKKRTARLLSDAGIPEANVEADRIICRVLGITRASLHAHPERAVRHDSASRIASLAERRKKHEPLAYILGSSLFCGIELKVDSRTLIPRPETEILCDIASSLLKEIEKKSGEPAVFADWCTGSGAIAISLLAENPERRCYAADSSAGALSVAEENAHSSGVASRVKFIECSKPESAAGLIPTESLDLITANPPYIPSPELASLETQVGAYEPTEALDGGPDGLDVYRMLLRGLPRYMKSGSPLLLETAGGDQPSEIAALADKTPEKLVLESKFKDHRGIERFMLWLKCELGDRI